MERINVPQDLYVRAARYGEDDILEQPLIAGARDSVKAIHERLFKLCAAAQQLYPQPGEIGSSSRVQ